MMSRATPVAMTRRLLYLPTALSLLALAAVAGAWVRSYYVGDLFHAARFDDSGPWTYRVRHDLGVARGLVGYTRSVASGGRSTYRASVEKSIARDPRLDPPVHRTVMPRLAVPGYNRKDVRCFGFTCGRTAYVRNDGSVCSATRRVTVPMWSLAILAALPLALRGAAGAWKRLSPAPGLCARCNYDLRATPHRCPECGTIAAAPPGA